MTEQIRLAPPSLVVLAKRLARAGPKTKVAPPLPLEKEEPTSNRPPVPRVEAIPPELPAWMRLGRERVPARRALPS